MLELKIKCPCDLLTEYSNNKSKIFFEFKPSHNKYTLIKKTKEFFLEENNKFNKELIHFFNIDKINASIYIYLEIEGKKILQEKNKGKNYKLLLNEIQNEKKEVICVIYENIELKIVIRIINKKEKIKSEEMDIRASSKKGIFSKPILKKYSFFRYKSTFINQLQKQKDEIIRKNKQIKEHDIFRQSFETYRSLQEVMGEKPQLVYMERNRKGMLGHLEKSVFRFPVNAPPI